MESAKQLPFRRRSRGYSAYVVAGLVVACAILFRWLLSGLLGTNVPFITLYLAVLVAAWCGGTGPALAATALSVLLAWYLFVPQEFSFTFQQPSDAVALGLFGAVCIAISVLGGRSRSAEQLARERETLHRVTIASIGDAVITTDSAGRLTGMNPIASSLCGWTEAEAIGRPLDEVLQLVNEHTRQPVENPVSKVIAQGHIVGLANHTVLIARDGSELPIDDSAAPIRGDDGSIIGVVMVFRDITERRAAEIGLERLAAIVETSDDAIIAKDLEGNIVSWNRSAERIFGYKAEEMIGQSITLLIPSDHSEEEDKILARLRRGEQIDHYETIRRTKDGRRIRVSLSISPLRDAHGELIGASKIARDITSQKESELARRESDDRFTTFMEALPGLAWIKDVKGRYVFINKAAEKPFGQPRGSLYGKTDDELFPPEVAAQFKANDIAALTTEHGVEVIETLAHDDGPHHSIVSKFPIPGPDGKSAFVGGVAIDITDRMRAQEALKQADRKKDEFLATLAHELRNPLAPIRNATKILQQVVASDDTARASIDMLDRQTSHMVRLIDDLLDISRISRGKIELRREPIELKIVVEQALETSRHVCDQMDHNLSVDLPVTPIHLYGDAIRLGQVFANLLTNACKFTPRGGEIRLSAQSADHEVVIRVEDNGIGIPVKDLPHIFAIFSQVDRSLERNREGLGIGLSLVKSLVELHGGSVEAHSEGVGTGSAFTVRLPTIVRPELAAPAPASTETKAVGGARRILVVDDNEDAATSLALLLRRLGHEVNVAHDGLEAVEAAAAVRPDVVLLDIGLPKLNGYDAGRQIREMTGNLKPVLIALTGWGQEEDRQRSKDAGFNAHLVKPVDINALVAMLSRFPMA